MSTIIEKAYGEYWRYVKDIVEEDGWVYTGVKGNDCVLTFHEHHFSKISPIESQREEGNSLWPTKGSRWRPLTYKK